MVAKVTKLVDKIGLNREIAILNQTEGFWLFK